MANCCSTQLDVEPSTSRRNDIPLNNNNRTGTCYVCGDILRRNITSVKCNNCSGWCYMRKCTSLKRHTEWNDHFVIDWYKNLQPKKLLPQSPQNKTIETHRDQHHSRTTTTQRRNRQVRRITTNPQPILSNPPSLFPIAQKFKLQHSQHFHFSILQFNCNGLRSISIIDANII